jgi:tetratricopeptide (TPR) repeat protein
MDSQKQLAECKSLFQQGRYFDAEQILTKMIENAEFGSLSDSEQAQLFLEFGRVLKKLAKFEHCEMYLTKARDIFKISSGTESYDYSEAEHQLAEMFYEQGDLPRAQELLQEVLVTRKALYKEPHKDVAIVLHHIGEVAWKQGDLKLALQNLDLALEMQKQCLGEMHEEYADTLGDRCLVMTKLGKVDEAEEGLRRGLEIRKACLPPDHAMIGNSLANLAFVLHAQGKNEHVAEMNRQAIDIAIKSYGEFSPRTATCINNLGGYYLSQGNLHEAVKYFEHALAIKEKVLGKDNPDLVTILGNVVIVYTQLKRTEEAQALRERVIALTRAKIEKGNPKDIDTMIALAEKLRISKKTVEAREVLTKALEVANTEYGSDSLKAALVLLHLGIHSDENDRAKAQDYLIKVLRIKKKHLGKKHPEVATALRALGNTLTAQGMRDVADLINLQGQLIEHTAGMEDPVIAALKKRLNEARDAYGPTDQKVTSQMRLLGEVFWNRGDKKEAHELFAEYLKIREQQLGANSPDLAQELMLKAVRIMPARGMLALDRPNTSVDVDPEDMKIAIELLERAVQIGRNNSESNEDGDGLISHVGQLIAAYTVNNELEKAESLAREIIDMVEKRSGNDHWSLAVPLFKLEKILTQQNRDEEAKEVEKRRTSLREPTRAEKAERSKKLSDRLSSSISSIMQGLVGVLGDEALNTAAAAASTSGIGTLSDAGTTSGTNTISGSDTGSDSSTAANSGTAIGAQKTQEQE